MSEMKGDFGISPIRFSPVGHWPMVKVQDLYWRKSYCRRAGAQMKQLTTEATAIKSCS
jgi:hypothetical protein